jgi:CRP/FNR family cyclic AMP-dependent transcriptional regulator
MASTAVAKKRSNFDPKTFLSTIDGGRKITVFSKKQKIFVQGDPSDAVFYVRSGKVKLTVVAKVGRLSSARCLFMELKFSEFASGQNLLVGREYSTSNTALPALMKAQACCTRCSRNTPRPAPSRRWTASP